MSSHIRARGARSISGAAPLRRVLVVEDEFHMAQFIDDTLRQMGLQVVGPVGTVRQAMILAESEPLDFALLDVRLRPDVRLWHSDRVHPVADLLRRRKIPFSFVTASVDPSIEWRPTEPVLRKPFGQGQLKDAVRKLMRRGSSTRR
ncbi:response regulator [Mycobacterium sp. KBS0706]|nr:response regulator [Mycobacterium sp. KBS0706]